MNLNPVKSYKLCNQWIENSVTSITALTVIYLPFVFLSPLLVLQPT